MLAPSGFADKNCVLIACSLLHRRRAPARVALFAAIVVARGARLNGEAPSRKRHAACIGGGVVGIAMSREDARDARVAQSLLLASTRSRLRRRLARVQMQGSAQRPLACPAISARIGVARRGTGEISPLR
mmetsp:Transcript_2056/g.5980  ORF Transcript_2056/g.5980 Transcript_2056/m.5980 type:complete len:130 (-) Transcript_2056:50-439(-)